MYIRRDAESPWVRDAATIRWKDRDAAHEHCVESEPPSRGWFGQVGLGLDARCPPAEPDVAAGAFM